MLSIAIATALISSTPHSLPKLGGVVVDSWEITTDPAGWFVAPSCITPTADGIYKVSTRVVFMGPGNSLTLAIRKKGAFKTQTIGQAFSAPRPTGATHVVLTIQTMVAAGECLFVVASANGGGTAYPRHFGVTQEVP